MRQIIRLGAIQPTAYFDDTNAIGDGLAHLAGSIAETPAKLAAIRQEQQQWMDQRNWRQQQADQQQANWDVSRTDQQQARADDQAWRQQQAQMQQANRAEDRNVQKMRWDVEDQRWSLRNDQEQERWMDQRNWQQNRAGIEDARWDVSRGDRLSEAEMQRQHQEKLLGMRQEAPDNAAGRPTINWVPQYNQVGQKIGEKPYVLGQDGRWHEMPMGNQPAPGAPPPASGGLSDYTAPAVLGGGAATVGGYYAGKGMGWWGKPNPGAAAAGAAPGPGAAGAARTWGGIGKAAAGQAFSRVLPAGAAAVEGYNAVNGDPWAAGRAGGWAGLAVAGPGIAAATPTMGAVAGGGAVAAPIAGAYAMNQGANEVARTNDAMMGGDHRATLKEFASGARIDPGPGIQRAMTRHGGGFFWGGQDASDGQREMRLNQLMTAVQQEFRSSPPPPGMHPQQAMEFQQMVQAQILDAALNNPGNLSTLLKTYGLDGN
jgi:hypothetical protein